MTGGPIKEDQGPGRGAIIGGNDRTPLFSPLASHTSVKFLGNSELKGWGLGGKSFLYFLPEKDT